MRRAAALYPPRAALLSLLLTPLVALSVSYPALLTKWYLPEQAAEDTLGTLLAGCFGGFPAGGGIPIAALAQYLMLFLPPIVLAGYGYARQGMRWQWMTALRYGHYAAWWREQLAGVWLGAVGYRLVQVGLILIFSLWEHRPSLEPLGFGGLCWMLVLVMLHTALWMHIQLLLQLIAGDARIGFGVPLLLLIFSIILGSLPGLHLPAGALPGLWGMAQRSWVLHAEGFGPWVLIPEALVIGVVSLGGWRYLKKVGLRSR